MTLLVIGVAGGLAAGVGEARLFRPPVFLAILALAGSIGAVVGAWRALASTAYADKPAICLWARGTPRLRHVTATALVLFVPAFDIYPLGLHRLVSLFLMLAR